MSSFFALLNQLAEPSGAQTPHNNPHATPTPVDTAALFRLLQDQLHTLLATAPTPENSDFLARLIDSLEHDIHDPPTHLHGVDQLFIDALDRVPRKTLRADDDCAICKVPYLDDEWCLVVELPCQGRHRFDIECVGPWLRSKGTCPMCRQDMGKKKPASVPADHGQDDEEENDMMYG